MSNRSKAGLYAEIAALRAEVERLREALTGIARMPCADDVHGLTCPCIVETPMDPCATCIARAALRSPSPAPSPSYSGPPLLAAAVRRGEAENAAAYSAPVGKCEDRRATGAWRKCRCCGMPPGEPCFALCACGTGRENTGKEGALP